ncbi:hypothetical protein FV219_00915 [Methylobacterium sp. WL122]|nr:hypothetical protein FV219_00915 [Methylobacterium sp. WL122]
MSLDIERLRKLLRMAFHPTTTVNEAHLAVKNAGRMLDSAGFGIDDLCIGEFSLAQKSDVFRGESSNGSDSLLSAVKSFGKIFDKYTALKAIHRVSLVALREAEARIASLEAEAAERSDNQHKADTGAQYVEFATISELAMNRCGRATWKSAVAFSINMPIRMLNAWKAVGIFPAHLVAHIDALSDHDYEPSSRQRWSSDEIDRLKVVLHEGRSDLEAAVILSKEFGRRIYETSVTYQRRRLFRIENWRPFSKRIRVMR